MFKTVRKWFGKKPEAPAATAASEPSSSPTEEPVNQGSQEDGSWVFSAELSKEFAEIQAIMGFKPVKMGPVLRWVREDRPGLFITWDVEGSVACSLAPN